MVRPSGARAEISWFAGSTGFFVGTLGALVLARPRGVDIGFAYYVWAGIFGVAIVAQFWAHAADCFDVDTGAAIVSGHHGGSDTRRNRRPFRSYRSRHDVLDAGQSMLVVMTCLHSTLPLVAWTRSSVPTHSRGYSSVTGASKASRACSSSIFSDRYLLLLGVADDPAELRRHTRRRTS